MKKQQLGIDEYKVLHQSGRLDEAKQGYLTILKQNPRDIDAMHLLALLHAEEGELDQAQHFLEKTIEIDSDSPSLRMHLANILKAKGLFVDASKLLLDVIETHPHFAAAYNNLGTVYYAESRFAEAITTYQKAIDLRPDYIDAYYNLGLALGKAGQSTEATNVYQSLLQLDPQHIGGQFQLGCLLMQQLKYQQAIDYFFRIEQIHPFHFETQSNLAACYIKTGLLNEAKTHYLKALELIPGDIQILFNLGVINMQQGRMKEAGQYYLQVVTMKPDYYEAHNNLGIALLSLKDINAALQHFREALRIQPDNEAIRHTVNILTQKDKLSVSPPEYIRSLFDSYADHYESHLLHALNYQVPSLMYQAVQSVADMAHVRWDILDLGCGTGLCGESFKMHARSLVGVDISENMLAVAAQKNIYDDLVLSDIDTYLQDKNNAYDLVVAGDVLVYIGDLVNVFQLVSQLLKHDGLFVFNVEVSEKEGYIMAVSGRFAHSQRYIEELAAKYSFSVLSSNAAVMRTQGEESVTGYIFTLKKIGVS